MLSVEIASRCDSTRIPARRPTPVKQQEPLMGPITIFDKSALQALSIDETVWLEAYFLSNVTPLFYVETLADLEKAVAEGRTSEEVVASLAERTPSRSEERRVGKE